jgi:hypothetical protein
MFDGTNIGERTGGGGGGSHAAAAVGDAVVEIVGAVAVSAVRGEENSVAGGPFGLVDGKANTVIHPVDHIIRGEHVVVATTVTVSGGDVHGAVEINTAIGPDMGFYIGNEMLERKNWIRGKLHVENSFYLRLLVELI